MDADLVRALRSRGIDVETATDAGLGAHADGVHLAHAVAHGRVLFSFNVGDYYHLHTAHLDSGRDHAGIVLARQQRYSIGELMRRLLHLVESISAEEMRNRVEFLSAW